MPQYSLHVGSGGVRGVRHALATTGTLCQLWIEAPAATFGLRSLEPLPFAAVNQVHHDAEHPSVLRLSTLPGRHAPTPHPTCGTVIRQPYRPDPIAVR